VGAMLTPMVKSYSDVLAHTLEVCKSARRYNEYSAIRG
jgi:hypothetical protein